MSKKHPIVAVTGSSGAGTTTVKRAFEHIFYRDGFKAAVVEGDSFHRYNRAEMRTMVSKGLSHFGANANHFDKLAGLFKMYGETGTGKKRYYIHTQDEADLHNGRLSTSMKPGEFSPWEDLETGTDLLFYEGLHGMAIDGEDNVSQHVDLGVGVVPIVNLEWIQKIFRDNAERGYTEEAIVDTIMRRMPDYINYVTPQFSRTDINFQRVPTVDTSNPFIARDIPTPEESFVVIRFRDPKRFCIDFPYLLSMLDGSFMSRRNSIVVPGGKMGFAMEIVLQPIIENMMERRDCRDRR
ncbi:MAG: phosphoribulokinase [Gammaproteobacteria bacterium]|nr:phosphoribulokinase [Gammaproteobacteria bacterium]